MNIKLGLFICVLALGQIGAADCRIVSLEKNPLRYVSNMIKNTPDIYYAEAISYSKEDEAFNFKVLDVLKGEKRKDFSVLGGQVEAGANESDFGSHKAQGFWEDVTSARTKFSADCRLTPKFQAGSRYLVFFKEPYQAKSFELVKTRADRWYKHVYETIHPPKKVKTQTASATTPAAPAVDSVPNAVTPPPASGN